MGEQSGRQHSETSLEREAEVAMPCRISGPLSLTLGVIEAFQKE